MTQDEIIRAIDTLNRLYVSYCNNEDDENNIKRIVDKINELVDLLK